MTLSTIIYYVFHYFFMLVSKLRFVYICLMNNSLVLMSPAKINLLLSIGNRMPDGYHPIASIFQAVSVADKINISVNNDNTIRIAGNCGCPTEKNSMYHATRLFFEASGNVCPGVDITIEKNIPIGSGLGGGSSNAATVLKALDAMFPGSSSDKHLHELAKAVGSDVPFFLGSPCAKVSGRGEILFPLYSRTDYCVLMAFPQPGVSTAEAYSLLDSAREHGLTEKMDKACLSAVELDRAAHIYKTMEPSEWRFCNDFYEVIAPKRPNIKNALEKIKEAGAEFASLSGSGCTVFGIFRTLQAAERAKTVLCKNYDTKICFPLASWP